MGASVAGVSACLLLVAGKGRWGGMSKRAHTESSGAQRVTWRPTGRATPARTQVVVLGWCVLLIGTWLAAMWLDSPVPSARWLMLTALMGLMLVWPAARLGEDRWRMSPAAVAVEWLCLVLVLQAVVWPLRIISGWRMDQTVWLDGAVLAWSFLSAAVVALGMQFRSGMGRTAAMVVCVLLVLGEPMALALAAVVRGGGPLWAMRVTPISTVWALTHPMANVSLAPWPGRVMTAGAAAVAAWVVVAMISAWIGLRRKG